MEISISFEKFLRYIEEVEGFEIDRNGERIQIRYHPLNPEALNHFDDKNNITIILNGVVKGDLLIIDEMSIREFDKIYEVDREYMEHFLTPWLEAIDHSMD